MSSDCVKEKTKQKKQTCMSVFFFDIEKKKKKLNKKATTHFPRLYPENNCTDLRHQRGAM